MPRRVARQCSETIDFSPHHSAKMALDAHHVSKLSRQTPISSRDDSVSDTLKSHFEPSSVFYCPSGTMAPAISCRHVDLQPSLSKIAAKILHFYLNPCPSHPSNPVRPEPAPGCRALFPNVSARGRGEAARTGCPAGRRTNRSHTKIALQQESDAVDRSPPENRRHS